MTADKSNLDPVLITVLARRLKSLTEEMALSMLRTTKSPILGEAKDFVVGLYGPEGEMLEQAEYLPVLAFSMRGAMDGIIKYFGDEVYEGDVIIHNDVFSGNGQLNDVGVYKPIFYDGELVAWSAAKGHVGDIGGNTPGGYNPMATEVWQEGIRITPVKVYEKGVFRRDVWDMIFANVRLPVVGEDMRAAIGSCVVGESGIQRLIDYFEGLGVYRTYLDSLFESTEQVMRSEIAALPDGTYSGESHLYGSNMQDLDGIYTIKVLITIKDSEIIFDYTGTSAQAPGYINAPYSCSYSQVFATLLMLINRPDLPHNEGMLKPMSTVLPQGTIVNPNFPAPTVQGNHIHDQQSEAIFSALAEAMPDRVTAAWNRMHGSAVVGWDPRNNRLYSDVMFLSFKGGSGATEGLDGCTVGSIVGGGGWRGQDHEMLELMTPNFLVKNEFEIDSGGPGKWRGGLGMQTIYRLDGENTIVSTWGDGIKEEARAFGLFSGLPGSINRLEIETPDGDVRVANAKDFFGPLPQGSVYHQWIGGGGGYGDPLERPVENVRDDVRNEYVSMESAERDYGVVMDPVTFIVDEEATVKLRESRLTI
jgi:N-methylhydantoinase B